MDNEMSVTNSNGRGTHIRRCTKCWRWLPLDDEHFARDVTAPGGWHRNCKECKNAKAKGVAFHLCSRCKKAKPVYAFTEHKTSKSGLQSYCRRCMAEYKPSRRHHELTQQPLISATEPAPQQTTAPSTSTATSSNNEARPATHRLDAHLRVHISLEGTEDELMQGDVLHHLLRALHDKKARIGIAKWEIVSRD